MSLTRSQTAPAGGDLVHMEHGTTDVTSEEMPDPPPTPKPHPQVIFHSCPEAWDPLSLPKSHPRHVPISLKIEWYIFSVEMELPFVFGSVSATVYI